MKASIKAILLVASLTTSVSAQARGAADAALCSTIKGSLLGLSIIVPIAVCTGAGATSGAIVGAGLGAIGVGAGALPGAGAGASVGAIVGGTVGLLAGVSNVARTSSHYSSYDDEEDSCDYLGVAKGHNADLIRQAQALVASAKGSSIGSAGPDLKAVTDKLNARLKQSKVKNARASSLQVAQAVLDGYHNFLRSNPSKLQSASTFDSTQLASVPPTHGENM